MTKKYSYGNRMEVDAVLTDSNETLDHLTLFPCLALPAFCSLCHDNRITSLNILLESCLTMVNSTLRTAH